MELQGNSFTERKNVGDLVIWEANSAFNRETVDLAPDKSIEIGTPLKADGDNVTPVTADGDTVIGVSLSRVSSGVATTARAVMLKRGPAMILNDWIEYAALTPATIRGKIEDLGIVVRDAVPALTAE